MKRFVVMLLTVCMAVALLAGCSQGKTEETSLKVSVVDPNMQVAMITDGGDITDQSYNQTTYEAGKAWCEANDVAFSTYALAEDSTAERVEMIKTAVAEGCSVLLLPGASFGEAIAETAQDYPDVKYIALDVSADALGYGYEIPGNVFCAVYREELAGYMAGYAAVRLGCTHLAFVGGMAVPGVVRYGYGFAQGADAAAAELGKADQVVLEVAYDNLLCDERDITAYADGLYEKGVEVIFTSGDRMDAAAAEAAAKQEGRKVIGNTVSDNVSSKTPVLTSAVKDLSLTVTTVLSQIATGDWSSYGGSVKALGLVSGTPEENFVRLSADTQFEKGEFSRQDYEKLVAELYEGSSRTVSDEIDVFPTTAITVVDLGTIK